MFNSIFFILSFILIVFAILCLLAVSDFSSKSEEIYGIKIKNDEFLLADFIIQIIVVFYFLLSFYIVYISSMALLSYIKKINININSLNNNQESNEIIQSEINYLGLDSTEHTLYEYQIKGHPRNLYYSFINNNNIIKEEEKKDIKDEDIIIVKDKNNNNFGLMNSENNLIDEEKKNPSEKRKIKNK